MNVVVPLCFASQRLLAAMYWTFHVLRLSNRLVRGSTLQYFVILCCIVKYAVVLSSIGIIF